MLLIGIILASAFFLLALHWWSEGVLDTSDAVLVAVVVCGLIFGLFAAHTMLQFIVAFIPLSAVAGYAIYSIKTGSMKAFYKRRCEDYISAIRIDPQNRAAREFLADALYNLGNLDQAIDELQIAVNMGAEMESRYKLSKWQKEQHFRDTDNPVCRWCETENAYGVRTCVRCGADLPCRSAFTTWLVGGKNGRGRYYLVVATGLVLTTASFLQLPVKFAFIPLILFICALVGWSLISSARL